jgi:hypothetical protein
VAHAVHWEETPTWTKPLLGIPRPAGHAGKDSGEKRTCLVGRCSLSGYGDSN